MTNQNVFNINNILRAATVSRLTISYRVLHIQTAGNDYQQQTDYLLLLYNTEHQHLAVLLFPLTTNTSEIK